MLKLSFFTDSDFHEYVEPHLNGFVVIPVRSNNTVQVGVYGDSVDDWLFKKCGDGDTFEDYEIIASFEWESCGLHVDAEDVVVTESCLDQHGDPRLELQPLGMGREWFE